MTAAFRGLLKRDRELCGMTEVQAARRFGVTLDFYRQLEEGTALPSWEVYDAAARRFGWPRSFVRQADR